jgi:cytochrome c-type biogenesis protein CcmH
MREAIVKLREHLKQHPDDLSGNLLLARSELGLGRYQEAADAYRRAAELSGQRPDISGDWGEAQVLAAGGIVTPGAREAFTAAMKDPEGAPRARYYLAQSQLQQGDAKAALQAWVDLEADSPAGAEWLPLLRQRIAEAAGALGVDPATVKGISSILTTSQECMAGTALATLSGTSHR